MKINGVLLEAQYIPDRALVTKRTDEKVYTLVNCITIRNTEGLESTVKALDGARFLMSDDGVANAISATTILCWKPEFDELWEFLNAEH